MPNAMKYALSGLLAGTLLGIGCQDDEAATSEIDMACQDYCAARTGCDDEVDEDDCLGRCFNNLNNCEIEELDEAIDKVNSCSQQTCDDLLECPVLELTSCRF